MCGSALQGELAKDCDGLLGTLTTRKTWHLLRHLIYPLKSKGESNRSMTRTHNAYACTRGDRGKILEDLKMKYLQTAVDRETRREDKLEKSLPVVLKR